MWALQKENAPVDNRAPFSHLATYLIAPLQGLSPLSAQRMLLQMCLFDSDMYRHTNATAGNLSRVVFLFFFLKIEINLLPFHSSSILELFL